MSQISRLAADYLSYITDEADYLRVTNLIQVLESTSNVADFDSTGSDTEIIETIQEIANKPIRESDKEQLERFIKNAQFYLVQSARVQNSQSALVTYQKSSFRHQITDQLDNLSLYRLSLTCFGLSQQVKDTLQLRKLAYFLVVNPSEIEVRKLIRAYPTLLQNKINIVKVRGVELWNNTPLQLSYGAGDPEMCLMIKEEMVALYGNEAAVIDEIRTQLEAKFIEVDKESDEDIKNQLAELLETVIDTITNEQFNLGRDDDRKLKLNPATLEAITTFRKSFDEMQPKVIEQGMHFRYNTLQETYAAYMQAATLWDYNRCALFEDGVLSSVLSYVPTNDGQRFSQGLSSLQSFHRERLTRQLTLRRTGSANFYEVLLAASPSFSTLSGGCVNIMLGEQVARGLFRSRGTPTQPPTPPPQQYPACYLKLCQAKIRGLRSLYSRADNAQRLVR